MNRRTHTGGGRAPLLILVLLGILTGITVFLKPFNPSLEKLKSPRIAESAKYHMNYQIVVSNTGSGGTVRGDLVFPFPASRFPYQRVEALTVDPPPRSVQRDERGNVVALLPLEIKEKEQKVVRLSFDVTLFHVSHELSSLPEDCGKVRPSPYLSAEGPFESGNIGIHKIVDEMATHEPNELYRAVRLYDMLINDFAFDEKLEPRPIDVLLREKKLQCCDANILFVSLCRATGIPAQFICGIYVSSRYLLFPQTHSWVQLYFPRTGWVPADPTLGRFDSRSRYLCLGGQRQFYIEMWRGYTDLAYFQPAEGNSPRPVIQLGMDIYPDNSYEGSEGPRTGLHQLMLKDSAPATVNETYSPGAFKFYDEGFSLEQQNNLKKAYELYERAVHESPKFIRAQKKLIALAYAMKRGDILKKNYDEMAARAPDDTILRYCRGLCLLYEAWYTEAEREFRYCERDGFTSAELYASLGYLYQKTKQITRAEESYALGLKAAGDHFAIYLNLLSMFQDAEDWPMMNYWAGEGLKEFPENHIFQGQMGYGLIRLGEPQKALIMVKKASEKDPGMGWYHALMGWAYRDLEEREQAKRELREALKMNRGIGNRKYYEDMLKELEQ
jgi:tetratricopeptide (TPR) repeat protein